MSLTTVEQKAVVALSLGMFIMGVSHSDRILAFSVSQDC